MPAHGSRVIIDADEFSDIEEGELEEFGGDIDNPPAVQVRISFFYTNTKLLSHNV